MGTDTAFDTQKQFLANVPDAISSPVDLPSAIKRYQDVLQYAGTQVHYVFCHGLYMMPSDMLLRVGQIAGYNNEIVIAPEMMALGRNAHVNAANINPQTHGSFSDEQVVSTPPAAVAAAWQEKSLRLSRRTVGRVGPQNNWPVSMTTKQTALSVGVIAVGLLALWLFGTGTRDRSHQCVAASSRPPTARAIAHIFF
ncbi:MAG: hypothetical protein ABW185_10970 [Sedimenticola sp.]